MNRFLLVLMFFSLQLPFCLSVTGEELKSEGAVLEAISYEKGDNDFEKIIFKLNGTHIPKIFKIKGEKPRLVFDFIDTRYSDLINNIINTEGGLIKGVRVGIHNDPPKTRVVVDLKPEGEIQFEQDFVVQDNILSITFHPDDIVAEDGTDSVKTEKAPEPSVASKTVVEKNKETAAVKKQSKKQNKDNALKGDNVNRSAEKTTKPVAVPEKKPKTDVVISTKEQGEVVEAPADKIDEPVNPILEQMTQEKPIPADPILKDVTFESTANDSEMVLFKLNDFYPPIVFGIEKGNPRVVCDFLDTDLAENVRSVIQTKGKYVGRVRTALHANPHKVRVVLDLVPNRNYDLQQVFFKEDNLFVVIINEFEEEPVQAPIVPAGVVQ